MQAFQKGLNSSVLSGSNQIKTHMRCTVRYIIVHCCCFFRVKRLADLTRVEARLNREVDKREVITVSPSAKFRVVDPHWFQYGSWSSILCQWGSRGLMTNNCKILQVDIFFSKIAIKIIPRSPKRTSKLRRSLFSKIAIKIIPRSPKRTSKLRRSLQTSKEKIQHLKFLHFFAILWVIFAFIFDSDPADQNQCGSRIHDTSLTKIQRPIRSRFSEFFLRALWD